MAGGRPAHRKPDFAATHKPYVEDRMVSNYFFSFFSPIYMGILPIYMGFSADYGGKAQSIRSLTIQPKTQSWICLFLALCSFCGVHCITIGGIFERASQGKFDPLLRVFGSNARTHAISLSLS